jgi:predicted TPR repeat methyltransferase
MSQLACLLANRAKSQQQGDEKRILIHQEALAWAERAVQIAPHKPFGHAALSEIHTHLDHRTQALRKAIECFTKTNNQHVVALAGLLVRLLVEPRKDEANRIRAGSVPHNLQHPSKRPLSNEEAVIYKRIQDILAQIIWKDDSRTVSNMKEREFIGLREYRLGLFFRKLEPADINRARSISLFQSATNHLPVGHSHRELVQFWLATLTEDSSITRCPADYVVGLYSTFAACFDDLLVKNLSYQTPTVLRQLLTSTLPNRRFSRAADLGCGTGLSGAAFRSGVAEHLTGVDLSPEMLVQADKRGCYDRLQQGDATVILNDEACYDLVLACDVFCYIGDLSAVFGKVHGALVDAGVFCFSTELLAPEGEDPPPDFRLRACARFAHSQRYIARLATAQSGFDILATKVCPIRKNCGKDVEGLLVILRKR